jgi:hypothetical protein
MVGMYCFTGNNQNDTAWESSYQHLISMYDTWVSGKLREICSKSPTFRSEFACLSIAFNLSDRLRCIGPKIGPYAFYTWGREIDPIPAFSEAYWRDLLDTNQLPNTQVCILDGQVQSAGLFLCVHFLVENARTERTMAFINRNRSTSRPWLSRIKKRHRLIRHSSSK